MIIKYAEVIDPETEGTFPVAGCETCGLGHTLSAPDDLGCCYNEQYHGNRHGITAGLCDRRRLRFVEGAVRNRGSLLDVGCGDGTFLLVAQRAGWAVYGNEFNPAPARSRGLTVSTSLEGGPYNCITLWHSLEHMADPLQLFTTLRQMLAPGGVLIVSVPNAGGPQARLFGANWSHLDVPRHLRHFTSQSLELLFGKAGFTVGRRWLGEWEYDVYGWVQSALNCLFRRKNVLFCTLTGRRTRAGKVTVVLSYVLGGILLLGASLFPRGGTLILAGKRNGE